MGRKDCFCREASLCPAGGSLHDARAWNGLEKAFPLPTHSSYCWTGTFHFFFWQKALWEQLVLKSILCVRIAGRNRPNRLGLMSFVTEDKTIRGGQRRQYGLLDESEDQGSLSPSDRWIITDLSPHCFEALPIMDALMCQACHPQGKLHLHYCHHQGKNLP